MLIKISCSTEDMPLEKNLTGKRTMKNTMNIPIRTLSIVGLIAGLATSAQAATLITPTTAISSKATTDHDALDTIGGELMTNTEDDNDYREWSMGASSSPTAKNDGWMADAGVATYLPWLIVDLGDTYDLETISIWNMNPSNGNWVERSVRDVNIYTSTTGFGTSNTSEKDGAFTATDYTLLTSLTLAGETEVEQNSGGSMIDNANGLVNGLNVEARYVAFEVARAYGNNNDRKRASIGEVQFFAIPEPSSYALLAGCFGLTWVMLRRRRS
jgi:hypothetical protein